MKIIIDPFHLHQSQKGEFVVTDANTYIRARNILVSAILEGQSTYDALHVYENPYLLWFADLPDQAEHISPRSLLSAKHPLVKLPQELTDQAIFNLGLLDANIQPTFAGLWRYFFDADMPGEHFSLAGLYTLADIVVSKKAVFENSFLANLWNVKLNELATIAPPAYAQLLIPLADADETYALTLAEGIYTAQNTAYFEKWLHEHSRYLRDIGINKLTFSQLLADNKSALPLSQRFEKNIYRFTYERLKNELLDPGALSGAYNAELDALIDLKLPLSLKTFSDLSEKFSGKLTFAQQQALTQLCIPDFTPPPPLPSDNLAEQMLRWKEWAVESFIPYKFYFDEAKSVSEEVLAKIELGSLAYSDWLFQNYKSIISNGDILTNFDVTRRIRLLLEEEDTKVIWLILDGFPAYFSTALRGILKTQGINQVESNWSLATLPTITELCIPLTLSGSYQTAADPGTSRSTLLNNALYPANCFYTTKISEFKDALQGAHDVCCLHTLEIDQLLHKSDADFDTSRAVEIANILEKRIRPIAELIRESAGQKIKLIISTDHGATKCLSKAKNIRNIRLEEAMITKPRERSVALNGPLAKEHIDPKEMYLLKKEMGQTWDDWAIARGYHYFGRHDSGYRHGGLSPEETIVPLLICSIGTAREIHLQLRHTSGRDLKFGKTEKDFRIKVSNTGGHAVEILALSILEDPNCLFPLPLQLSPDGETTLHGQIKLPQKLQLSAKGGKLALHFSIDCLLLGERISQTLTCNVATAKDDFEDEFDF